jgi:hypothetical protein
VRTSDPPTFASPGGSDYCKEAVATTSKGGDPIGVQRGETRLAFKGGRPDWRPRGRPEGRASPLVPSRFGPSLIACLPWPRRRGRMTRSSHARVPPRNPRHPWQERVAVAGCVLPATAGRVAVKKTEGREQPHGGTGGPNTRARFVGAVWRACKCWRGPGLDSRHESPLRHHRRCGQRRLRRRRRANRGRSRRRAAVEALKRRIVLRSRERRFPAGWAARRD